MITRLLKWIQRKLNAKFSTSLTTFKSSDWIVMYKCDGEWNKENNVTGMSFSKTAGKPRKSRRASGSILFSLYDQVSKMYTALRDGKTMDVELRKVCSSDTDNRTVTLKLKGVVLCTEGFGATIDNPVDEIQVTYDAEEVKFTC